MCKTNAPRSNCDSCVEAVITNGTLKAAQNEAFQDGITYAIFRIIQSNVETKTFDQSTLSAVLLTLKTAMKDDREYEYPVCSCMPCKCGSEHD
jgi:hypothetical protein